MFSGANSFNNANQPLTWNTQNVTDMMQMFKNATAFDQPLVDDQGNGWNVGQVTSMVDMFIGGDSGGPFFKTVNYSNFLINCAEQATTTGVQSNVQLDASATPNAEGETAKTTLRDNHNWTINDGGT